MFFFLLFIVSLSSVSTQKITTFFLNSKYSFETPLEFETPKIDCVHMENSSNIALSEEITFCYRAMPLLYINKDNPWTSVIGFGKIEPDFTNMEEGFVFGIYKALIWIGIKTSGDELYSWISLGKNTDTDLQVWRHICVSINFRSGNIKLVDNSELRFDGHSEKIKVFSKPISFVSVGCFYKNSGNTLYMSMYGRVTDFQIFRQILILYVICSRIWAKNL